jgi:hypothetical protein
MVGVGRLGMCRRVERRELVGRRACLGTLWRWGQKRVRVERGCIGRIEFGRVGRRIALTEG